MEFFKSSSLAYYLGEGNGNPLQCSCLESLRDGGAWWAAIYGVIQSWTRLTWLSNSSSSILPGIFFSQCAVLKVRNKIYMHLALLKYTDMETKETNYNNFLSICITDLMDMNLGKLQEMVRDREACHAVVHGVKKSQIWLGNWTTTTKAILFIYITISWGNVVSWLCIHVFLP